MPQGHWKQKRDNGCRGETLDAKERQWMQKRDTGCKRETLEAEERQWKPDQLIPSTLDQGISMLHHGHCPASKPSGWKQGLASEQLEANLGLIDT